jgi:hypothetical protein
MEAAKPAPWYLRAAHFFGLRGVFVSAPPDVYERFAETAVPIAGTGYRYDGRAIMRFLDGDGPFDIGRRDRPIVYFVHWGERLISYPRVWGYIRLSPGSWSVPPGPPSWSIDSSFPNRKAAVKALAEGLRRYAKLQAASDPDCIAVTRLAGLHKPQE